MPRSGGTGDGGGSAVFGCPSNRHPFPTLPSGGGRKRVALIAILWVTPQKPLAADTTLSLQEASAAMQPTWTVGLRTGDVSSSERAKQDRRLPTVLVTTPESLALMLARADWRERLAHCVR